MKEKNEILFSFKGMFSQDVLSNATHEVEDKLREKGEAEGLISKVFAVMTEEIQNVMFYTKESPIPASVFISYDKEAQKYLLCTKNVMNERDKDSLVSKLEKINSLNEMELKAYYKDLRRSGNDKHKKGAGLGFLEMAKRSNETIRYKFSLSQKKDIEFELKVYIK